MIRALLLAFAEVGNRRLRRIFLLSLGLAVAVFGLLWAGLGTLVYNTAFFDFWLWNRAVDLLGGIAALVLTWLLFPAVVTLIMGFYLDGFIGAVEQVHYPDLPAARSQPWAEVIAGVVRLAVLAVFLNLLALPLYILVPGLNLVLFYLINGYLLGREYFEMVALRRLPAREVRSLWLRRRGQLMLAGMIIAFLLSLPLVNLVAPLFAASFMAHLFHRRQRYGELLGAR